MTLLIAFLLVLITPLLIGSWRVSLAGLAAQGLLLGWLSLETRDDFSAGGILTLVDLLVLRGALIPSFLHRVALSQNRPQRSDVVPPNLFSWTAAAAIVLLSFRFSQALSLSGDRATHTAIAASAVLLGLFILATQNGLFAQIVGILRIENGIALFELQSEHHLPVGVHLGVLVVFALSALLYVSFLRTMDTLPETTPADDRPTL